MTGFGSGAVDVAGGRAVAEVRSVNSRFLEVKLVLPREHQAAEAELREAVQGAIERGRVDVSLRREGTARREVRLDVDIELARAHAEAWRRVRRELKLEGDVDLALLRSSGGDIVRAVEAPRDPARDLAAFRRALQRALEAHQRDRQREGANLLLDMRARVKALEAIRRDCVREASGLKSVLTERLSTRVAALLGADAPDPVRLVQEVVIAVERGDFSEELTRLGSHLEAFSGLLREREPVGKRIEFLLQEMVREVNTIGSKANHLPVTQAVLRAKAELEKLREQAANVE